MSVNEIFLAITIIFISALLGVGLGLYFKRKSNYKIKNIIIYTFLFNSVLTFILFLIDGIRRNHGFFNATLEAAAFVLYASIGLNIISIPVSIISSLAIRSKKSSDDKPVSKRLSIGNQ